MSPTVYREGSFRFYLFSREELRPHIHVEAGNGEAKYWLEPIVALAMSSGMRPKDLSAVQRIVEKRRERFLAE